MLRAHLSHGKNYVFHFELWKREFILISIGYKDSSKFVEKTRNIVLVFNCTWSDPDLFQGRNNSVEDVQLCQRPYLSGILALRTRKGMYAWISEVQSIIKP